LGYIKETGYKGGVKVVDTAEQARDFAHEVIGKHLVTV
jgi:succinyl-CoA synthetase beta subunit